MDEENGSRRIWIIAAMAVVVTLALLAAGWFVGRPVYRHYKEKRCLAQAQAFMAKNDYRNASLSARQTLGANPSNLDACRIMASLAELARSPAVIDWRRRIAEIEPTAENKLMLAATGLRHQPPPYALSAQILEDLSPTATNLVAFHVVSAEMALKLNHPAEAESHFAAAAALEPTNRLHPLNLSVLRLRSTNADVAAAARATLESLRDDTNLGPVALRWLVGDALGRSNTTETLAFSRQLLTNTHAGLEDQLQHLNVLKQSEAAALHLFLGSLQRQYATNAGGIYAVATWMAGNGLADDAVSWLKELPANTRSQQAVQLALTDCYMAKADWPAVENFLAEQKWKELDFLRFAYRSLAAEKTRAGLAVEAHWRSAVREAGERLGALTALLSMADKWNRQRAKEDLLWLIANRFPRERWAFKELDRLYLANGNTRGLNRVYSAMLGPGSTNLVLKNNLAATALLLKANLATAHELAREVFQNNPKEPILASTYAYSLHLQGRTGEGIRVLQQFKPEELAKQPVALYYGLLLWSVGQTNEAGRYLDVAAASGTLLPEEKALLAACKP